MPMSDEHSVPVLRLLESPHDFLISMVIYELG